MTTKPKAKKFRIRRTVSTASSGAEPVQSAAPKPQQLTPDAASGPRPVPDAPASTAPASAASSPKTTPVKAEVIKKAATTARSGEMSSPKQVAGELDMDAIRREGLTGRQLRMARRVAQKNGLAPTSDFDAVRQLRAKGIDPFQRSNMLELVVPPTGNAEASTAQPQARVAAPAQQGNVPIGRIQLPQTVPAGGTNLPSSDVTPAERRKREISDIQRDITQRRRRKMALLLVRLAFFVFLPTFAAGYYFYKIATPMYATDSQFLIIQSEGGGAGPLSGFLPTQFATGQDSIATQAFLQSKDAMLRLDADAGFKDHFANDDIDPLQRLNPDPSNEEAYKMYKKNVKIGFDPTEGVVRMEVIAADPQIAVEFSNSLIKYAEERVNNLSKGKREDGMRDALSAYEEAQDSRQASQEALIELQAKNGVDPQAEILAIRAQITTYEGLLIEKELGLAALLDNPRPNQARVDGARGDVRRLEEQIVKLQDKLNSATQGSDSLAQKAVELQLAQADLASADMILQGAQASMDQARIEANRQVRYLTVAVRPVPSEEPSYPRKFENTILAFLIFAGIYLMLSLTASILREQVTS